MGQKVNPHGLRVGVIKDWDSRWFAKDDAFGDILVEDYKLRKFLKKTLYDAGIPKIEIERDATRVRIHVHCSRPGIVIGKGGAEIEKVRRQCDAMINKGKADADKRQVFINVVEIKQPDKNAQLVAESIASQLEARVSFRRAMKQAIGRAMKFGAKGIKVAVPDAWAAQKSPEANITTRAPSRCRPSARTSTTASPRRTRLTEGSASRSGFTPARCSGMPSVPAGKEATSNAAAEKG